VAKCHNYALPLKQSPLLKKEAKRVYSQFNSHCLGKIFLPRDSRPIYPLSMKFITERDFTYQ